MITGFFMLQYGRSTAPVDQIPLCFEDYKKLILQTFELNSINSIRNFTAYFTLNEMENEIIVQDQDSYNRILEIAFSDIPFYFVMKEINQELPPEKKSKERNSKIINAKPVTGKFKITLLFIEGKLSKNIGNFPKKFEEFKSLIIKEFNLNNAEGIKKIKFTFLKSNFEFFIDKFEVEYETAIDSLFAAEKEEIGVEVDLSNDNIPTFSRNYGTMLAKKLNIKIKSGENSQVKEFYLIPKSLEEFKKFIQNQFNINNIKDLGKMIISLGSSIYTIENEEDYTKFINELKSSDLNEIEIEFSNQGSYCLIF